jgi:hypothetical protein
MIAGCINKIRTECPDIIDFQHLFARTPDLLFFGGSGPLIVASPPETPTLNGTDERPILRTARDRVARRRKGHRIPDNLSAAPGPKDTLLFLVDASIARWLPPDPELRCIEAQRKCTSRACLERAQMKTRKVP